MPAFFFYANNAPDASIILNRNTEFELDISKDVISFNTSNDIDSLFGNFTVVIDNTNDKHVDQFGFTDVTKMSSIEIFVKSNIAYEGVKNPHITNNHSVTSQEGQSIGSIIETTYGLNNFSSQTNISQYKNSYISGIIKLNPGLFVFTQPTNSTQNISSSNCDYTLAPGQIIKLPPMVTQYKKIFLGVVLNVAQSFQAGSAMTITLSGEAIGWWLKASTVNIHPSLSELGLPIANIDTTNLNNYAYSNKYNNTKALDIFKDLLKASTNNVLTVADFNLATLNNSQENTNATSNSALNQVFTDELGQAYPATGTPLTLQSACDNAVPPISTSTANTQQAQLNLLDQLKTSIMGGTLLDGTNIKNVNANDPNYPGDTSQNIQDFQNALQTINSPSGVKTSTNITTAQNNLSSNPIVTSQFNMITKFQNNLQSQISQNQNPTSTLFSLGIMQHWQQIFSQMILEVADASYLTNIYPFKMTVSSPLQFDGEYVDKATIAKQVSNAINFELYIDTNGHFILKPPLYNIGIPYDDPTYIIEQEDITSMNINDGVDGIITQTTVTGDFHEAPGQIVREQTLDIHTDLNLVQKYGLHNVSLQNLIFLRTSQDCANFGESYMAKNNQELAQADVTIMGRPDIRLGVACYLVPRDTIYYIKSISHNFQVGSDYTTTLSMIGARRIITGYLINSVVSSVSRTYLHGIDIRETEPVIGSSISHYVLANSTASMQLVNNSIAPNSIVLIKNSYVITSNPNIGFVGLIVDQNSVLLNDINSNIFNYINQTSQQAVNNPNNSIYQAATIQGNNIAPFQIIQTYINGGTNTDGTPNNGFLKDNGISVANAATTFNQAMFEQFNSTFINYIQGLMNSARTGNTQQSGNNLITIQNLSDAAQYFSQMVSDAGSFGSYRPYTDQYGREYPITLNYGQGLITTNSSISANTNSPAQSATQTQAQINAQVQAIIAQANTNASNNSQSSIVNPPSINVTTPPHP